MDDRFTPFDGCNIFVEPIPLDDSDTSGTGMAFTSASQTEKLKSVLSKIAKDLSQGLHELDKDVPAPSSVEVSFNLGITTGNTWLIGLQGKGSINAKMCWDLK